MILGFDLPPDVQLVVEEELRPNEGVVWAGQPRVGLYARSGWGAFFIGLGILHVVALVSSRGSWDPQGKDFSWFPVGMTILLGVCSLGVMTTPYWMRRRARRTVYVLTDRRAIVFDAGWRTSMTVRSFDPSQLNDMRRVQHTDGAGDLVFDRTATTDSDGKIQFTDRGFLAIDEVKRVEERVLLMVQAKG